MNYEQAKKHKQDLEKLNSDASSKLEEFETGIMGLTPEHIRMTDEYQNAKKEYDKTFTELRNYNKWFLGNYKKEYLKDRKENRFKIK